MNPEFTRKLIIGLVLGVVVLVGLGIYADLQQLSESLQQFQWWLLVPVLGLTLLNYLLRFFKWHYYLKRLGAQVSIKNSGIVFLSGLSMAVTPGKFGELLKALLLKERCGTPAAETASVVVAERFTDFLALVFLAAGGVVASQHGSAVLTVSVIGCILFLLVLSSERASMALIDGMAGLPRIGALAPRFKEAYQAIASLLRPAPLIGTTLLSIAAWFCECVGFYLVLSGLPDTTPNLGSATFIYAFATIFGAVTMLPGGLAATEGSLIGLSHQVFGLTATKALATAGALIIRFCTLWFAVVVGLVTLALSKGSSHENAG